VLGDPIAWLEAHGAQRDVLDGLREHARDWRSLWRDCPRGDWLLGIATRLGVDHVALVRAAIGCARTALDRYEGTEAETVLEIAARWCDGMASAEDVALTTRALEAAAAHVQDPSADAAARAVQAVGLGIADREVLVSAAAFAAEATIVATMECGLEMAMGWAHRACADAVRAAIAWELVEARASLP
jgi:hypothetical protein